ncbi:MAG: response regulator [Cyanobacteria bacterium J06621_12]
MISPSEKESKLIQQLRVIIVDDVPDCRDVVELYLLQKNALVEAVDSADDVFKIIESFQPDLIISDICMPRQDGYWLIEKLNQLNLNSEKYVPSIALTAAAKVEEQEAIIAAGYDGYLAKPFMFEDLTNLIVDVMNRGKLSTKN